MFTVSKNSMPPSYMFGGVKGGGGGGKPLNQGTTGIRTVGRLMFPMPRPDRGTIDLYDLCAGVVILSWELSV